MRERCVHCGNDLPDGSQDFMCERCLGEFPPAWLTTTVRGLVVMVVILLAVFLAFFTAVAWFMGVIG